MSLGDVFKTIKDLEQLTNSLNGFVESKETLPLWCPKSFEGICSWMQKASQMEKASYIKFCTSLVKILQKYIHVLKLPEEKEGFIEVFLALNDYGEYLSKYDISRLIYEHRMLLICLWEALHNLVLTIIESNASSLTPHLNTFGGRFLKLALDSEQMMFIRQIKLKALNSLLEKVPNSIRNDFKATHFRLLERVPSKLKSAGDYDFQTCLLEIMFRTSSSSERRENVSRWFAGMPTCIHYLFLGIKDFDPDCRKFLNAYNSWWGDKRSVYSFCGLSAKVGNYMLHKVNLESSNELWIDFNRQSNTISILHDRSHEDCSLSEPYWETMQINYLDINTAKITSTEDILTISLQLIKDPLDLFESPPSQTVLENLNNSVTLTFAKGQERLEKVTADFLEGKVPGQTYNIDPMKNSPFQRGVLSPELDNEDPLPDRLCRSQGGTSATVPPIQQALAISGSPHELELKDILNVKTPSPNFKSNASDIESLAAPSTCCSHQRSFNASCIYCMNTSGQLSTVPSSAGQHNRLQHALVPGEDEMEVPVRNTTSGTLSNAEASSVLPTKYGVVMPVSKFDESLDVDVHSIEDEIIPPTYKISPASSIRLFNLSISKLSSSKKSNPSSMDKLGHSASSDSRFGLVDTIDTKKSKPASDSSARHFTGTLQSSDNKVNYQELMSNSFYSDNKTVIPSSGSDENEDPSHAVTADGNPKERVSEAIEVLDIHQELLEQISPKGRRLLDICDDIPNACEDAIGGERENLTDVKAMLSESPSPVSKADPPMSKKPASESISSPQASQKEESAKYSKIFKEISPLSSSNNQMPLNVTNKENSATFLKPCQVELRKLEDVNHHPTSTPKPEVDPKADELIASLPCEEKENQCVPFPSPPLRELDLVAELKTPQRPIRARTPKSDRRKYGEKKNPLPPHYNLSTTPKRITPLRNQPSRSRKTLFDLSNTFLQDSPPEASPEENATLPTQKQVSNHSPSNVPKVAPLGDKSSLSPIKVIDKGKNSRNPNISTVSENISITPKDVNAKVLSAKNTLSMDLSIPVGDGEFVEDSGLEVASKSKKNTNVHSRSSNKRSQVKGEIPKAKRFFTSNQETGKCTNVKRKRGERGSFSTDPKPKKGGKSISKNSANNKPRMTSSPINKTLKKSRLCYNNPQPIHTSNSLSIYSDLDFSDTDWITSCSKTKKGRQISYTYARNSKKGRNSYGAFEYPEFSHEISKKRKRGAYLHSTRYLTTSSSDDEANLLFKSPKQRRFVRSDTQLGVVTRSIARKFNHSAPAINKGKSDFQRKKGEQKRKSRREEQNSSPEVLRGSTIACTLPGEKEPLQDFKIAPSMVTQITPARPKENVQCTSDKSLEETSLNNKSLSYCEIEKMLQQLLSPCESRNVEDPAMNLENADVSFLPKPPCNSPEGDSGRSPQSVGEGHSPEYLPIMTDRETLDTTTSISHSAKGAFNYISDIPEDINNQSGNDACTAQPQEESKKTPNFSHGIQSKLQYSRDSSLEDNYTEFEMIPREPCSDFSSSDEATESKTNAGMAEKLENDTTTVARRPSVGTRQKRSLTILRKCKPDSENSGPQFKELLIPCSNPLIPETALHEFEENDHTKSEMDSLNRQRIKLTEQKTFGIDKKVSSKSSSKSPLPPRGLVSYRKEDPLNSTPLVVQEENAVTPKGLRPKNLFSDECAADDSFSILPRDLSAETSHDNLVIIDISILDSIKHHLSHAHKLLRQVYKKAKRVEDGSMPSKDGTNEPPMAYVSVRDSSHSTKENSTIAPGD